MSYPVRGFTISGLLRSTQLGDLTTATIRKTTVKWSACSTSMPNKIYFSSTQYINNTSIQSFSIYCIVKLSIFTYHLLLYLITHHTFYKHQLSRLITLEQFPRFNKSRQPYTSCFTYVIHRHNKPKVKHNHYRFNWFKSFCSTSWLSFKIDYFVHQNLLILLNLPMWCWIPASTYLQHYCRIASPNSSLIGHTSCFEYNYVPIY